LLKTANGREQVIELTAKACARDFFDIEASLPQAVGVDQIRRLIIGHNPDLKPFFPVTARQTTEGRRLARPQKTADHQKTHFAHRIAPLIL
jgi:hypothetical protein